MIYFIFSYPLKVPMLLRIPAVIQIASCIRKVFFNDNWVLFIFIVK